MKILVIGNGGREHALCKKFLASPKVTAVYCAPGNDGMKNDGILLVPLAVTQHQQLISFAKNNAISFTFVGPEVPLLNGIVDDFNAAGLKAYGPTKAAALIEGSKDFAKQLMAQCHIPTAASQTFSELEAAKNYLATRSLPIVIKADGLAAGKGVVVALTSGEAELALEEMLGQHKFGDSSARVVIEDFLAGEEFSLLAFVRGTEVYPMIVAQDHKRAFDGDLGPNTGGMGAYAPVPQISAALVDEAVAKILKPAAAGMVALGRPFNGILYAGLIATSSGPKVIEFNARFGDPETQVVLPQLASDLAVIIDDLLNDRVPEIIWQQNSFSLGVVVASDGYPGNYKNGALLPDFDKEKKVTVSYAGVKKIAGHLAAAGGRVYLVEATAPTLAMAQQQVYDVLDQATTSGTFYRHDIGAKALKK